MPATLEEIFCQCLISSISDATWSAGPVSRPWAIAARQDRPESSQSVRFSGRIAVHGIENCQVLHGFENEPFWFSRPVQLHIFSPNPIPLSFQVLVGHKTHHAPRHNYATGTITPIFAQSNPTFFSGASWSRATHHAPRHHHKTQVGHNFHKDPRELGASTMLRESPRSAVACGSCVRERYHHKTLVGHNLHKDSRELGASIMLRESLRSADACGSCVRARYHRKPLS